MDGNILTHSLLTKKTEALARRLTVSVSCKTDGTRRGWRWTGRTARVSGRIGEWRSHDGDGEREREERSKQDQYQHRHQHQGQDEDEETITHRHQAHGGNPKPGLSEPDPTVSPLEK
uniref:Uncharacterized protein n=1 Tax=Coccidioides posadasii RMSCC 3488 TaxID=454284 RepID=A0A0J6HZP8_COCPO|nr:hypothetical protein CPAG_00819 [Coccidioides posadasii RMSCC 3488]